MTGNRTRKLAATLPLRERSPANSRRQIQTATLRTTLWPLQVAALHGAHKATVVRPVNLAAPPETARLGKVPQQTPTQRTRARTALRDPPPQTHKAVPLTAHPWALSARNKKTFLWMNWSLSMSHYQRTLRGYTAATT